MRHSAALLASCCATLLLALATAPAQADDLSNLATFGSFGAGAGQFDHPIGTGIGDDGHLWVVDALNDRVQEWTADGTFLRTFGSTGTGRGRFRLPEDVEARGGFVYVSDCYGQRVQRFNAATLAPAGEFTGGPTRLVCPEGLDVGPGGEVYVTDTFNERIVVYDPTTNAVLKTFGTIDGEPLPQPRDVAVSAATGQVYVTVDAGGQCANGRVARLAPDGTVLGTFGAAGAGKLFCPLGVHLDAAGNVIVSDAGGRVNLYTADGQFALALKHPADNTAFAYAAGIATDAQCRIYIAERDLARIVVYGWATAPFCRTLPAAPAAAAPTPKPIIDKTPPALSVGWPASVRLRRSATLTMRVRCPFEKCLITAFGTIKVGGRTRWWMQVTRTPQLKAGRLGTVTLRFRKRTDLGGVRALLRRGRHPKLELAVSASDAKGNYVRKRKAFTLR